MKIINYLSFFTFLMLLPVMVKGQYFSYYPINRPAGQNWQQFKTEHFRIIFPDGKDSLARRAAQLLESHYPSAAELTGGALVDFPVILKDENDLSNGFVSSFNFRSEIDLVPQKGKGMNPKTGYWLEIVLPHELVHATHFNVQQKRSNQKVSLSNFISYFSPDFARSIHGFVPYGLHEGLAVYYETEQITPDGGRGNYSFATNNFNAVFNSPYRWNMGQTFIPSDYSLPNNRHYLAGYSFLNWMHENYGEAVSKESIRFHYNHFMFGYGFALRKVTGYWPGQLFNFYEEDLEEQAEERLSNISDNTTEKSEIIYLPFKGEQTRGPIWLSDTEILFYGSFYNSHLGFYRYNLDTDKYDFLKETYAVGDYNYEIDADSNLIYSSYSRDPLYSGIYVTDIQQLNLASGKQHSLTNNARVFAPSRNAGRTVALQFKENSHRIVEILDDGSVKVLKQLNDGNPISIKINPVSEQVAILVNRSGVQALWISTLSNLADDLAQNPDLAFRDGSIHDVEWHPNGEKILFTMDAPPAMDIYEYDLETEEITQLTSSLYNAFEASYSPNGKSIAYVIQSVDEKKIAILDSFGFLNKMVPKSELYTEEELEYIFSPPLLDDANVEDFTWEKEKYRAGISWLKPRTMFPVIRENANEFQYGAGISSIDALSGQSYRAEITGIQNKLWYDFTYSNKTFYPGFEINAYSDPDFFALEDQIGNEYAIMQQTRGLGLSIPFTYTFRGDTRLSSIFMEPEISAEQFKYYNLIPTEISDFATRYKAGIFSQLSLGILNLSRDVQPSAGISIFGLFEHTLNEPTLDFTYSENPTISGKQFFGKQWTAYYGVFAYLAPLRKFNQSLRLDVRLLQQSQSPIYSNNTIVPMGFSKNPFQSTSFNNIGRISTRYTIPVFYPDTGGLTVPLYLSSIYLTGFSHTLTDINSGNLLDSSRSIFGVGFHVQFKLSNVQFDFGLGVAYEPSRLNTQFIFGQF